MKKAPFAECWLIFGHEKTALITQGGLSITQNGDKFSYAFKLLPYWHPIYNKSFTEFINGIKVKIS